MQISFCSSLSLSFVDVELQQQILMCSQTKANGDDDDDYNWSENEQKQDWIESIKQKVSRIGLGIFLSAAVFTSIHHPFLL